MHDLQELDAWLDARGVEHEMLIPSTLPDPCFLYEGREQVSFSTNNYLALATSSRLKARARAALDRYGVGNCESRLLGGNLAIYEELEAKLARLKGKDAALIFATGYLTNLGVLPSSCAPRRWRAPSAIERVVRGPTRFCPTSTIT